MSFLGYLVTSAYLSGRKTKDSRLTVRFLETVQVFEIAEQQLVGAKFLAEYLQD